MGLPVPELVPVPVARTGIGNLRVWVTTYIFRCRSYLVTDVGTSRILDSKGGCMNFLEA